MRLGDLQRFLDDLDALALEHVGKARVVLEMSMIELGDQLMLGSVPVMKDRRDDPARLDLLIKADPIEHFERGRMIGPGARNLIEKVVLPQRLDQDAPDALLRQRQRQAEPDRPGADDDYAIRV